MSNELLIKIETLIQQGETTFAGLIEGYPYVILVPLTINDDERDTTFIDEIEIIEDWLNENISGEYISFPNNAIGKYKSMWQYVYFKNNNDAIRFKLVWG